MDPSADLDRTLFVLRVIVGAMAFGVVAFGLIVIFVMRPEPGPAEVLLVCLVALGIAELVAWVVVGRMARRRLRRQLEEAPSEQGEAVLRQGFFNLAVVRAALCEAFCFFALIVYLLTAAVWALLAAAAGLLVVFAWIPSRQRYQQFADGLRGRRPV